MSETTPEIFPTRVGVNRRRECPDFPRHRLPHARGGEPVLVSVEIDFADYFNDYGFGDGDGPEAAIAARYLEQMVGEINARLDRDGLVGVTVEEGADGSLHNNSTIRLLHKGKEITVERDHNGSLAAWNDGIFTDDVTTTLVALDRILEEVENDFESRFLQKENA